eukprot:4837314-Alexandrium_andersonii.AAC.1
MAVTSAPSVSARFPHGRHAVTMRKHTSAVAARVDVEWRPCCLKYFHKVRRDILRLSRGSALRNQAV